MDIITQTNRAILFEEINPEKNDLLTLIGEVKGRSSLSDDKIKEIHESLLASSFEEFLELFSPVVYSFFNANNQMVMYSLKKPENIPENCITEIPLTMDNDFLKMLLTLIETKGAMGIANVDFKFDKILDMISPKKIMDDIRQSRKEIQYIYGQYEALEEGDPKKLDLGDKLNYMFEQASQNYNNVMAMLPLAIEDIKTRLLLGDGQKEESIQTFKAGLLSMGEDGELKILEVSKEENTQLAVINDSANTGLIEAFKEDYDALNENQSDYVRELVVRTYCPLTSTLESEVNVQQEVTNYNNYLDFYKQTKDDFVKVVKPLIEKILGVKTFFDQYKVKENGMKPTLLVTNNRLEQQVKANNLPRLITYLNTVNDKNEFDNTIWFGIIPNVEIEQNKGMKLQRIRFGGNEKAERNDRNTMESVANLMNAIYPYKITTFFSFEPGEETTFSDMASTGVEKYKEKCKFLMKKEYSEFLVPCIPNITIIPKDKSGVILDKKMIMDEEGMAALSKEKEDIMKLWIEGVYIGAAYVAAGLTAAWQCPAYLKERFSKTTRNYPGVRFDIEAASHALCATTTMTKEISGFTNAIKNDINTNGFGFVFSSENAQYKGKDIRNIMVYKARNLQVSNHEFEPIYKTLVSTYIERILRFSSNDFKKDNIQKFFSNNPDSQRSKWGADRDFVNSILQEGDELSCEIDDIAGICSILVTFNNNTKNLRVAMNKKTS